jgi:hypothetical protein
MPALKFTRKLGTAWVFELTWKDRRGQRQSIAGASNKRAFWRSMTADTVIVTDTGGFTIDETADPNTFGDFTYRRADLTLFATGRYRLDFEAELNGEIVPAPEDTYIIVEVLD